MQQGSISPFRCLRLAREIDCRSGAPHLLSALSNYPSCGTRTLSGWATRIEQLESFDKVNTPPTELTRHENIGLKIKNFLSQK